VHEVDHSQLLASNATTSGDCNRRLHAGEAVEPYVDIGTKRDGSHRGCREARVDGKSPGGVVAVTAILRDITDERRTQRDPELALERSRTRFEQLRTPQALINPRGGSRR
jgi:hypothetical protein